MPDTRGIESRGSPGAGRPLLRIAALSSVSGIVVLLVAESLHGGHEPGNLRATLPIYAANPLWEVVHIGQFLGYVLLLGGLVGLQRSITGEPGAAFARLGLVVAVVAVGIYGTNQGVDGVAIKFVAKEWVDAPSPQKADAFVLADAVRHVEIGLTSFSQLALGVALVLFGLALSLGRGYQRLFGVGAVALAALYVVSGALVAHKGFTVVAVTATAGLLLAAWFVILAVILWRKAARARL